MAELDVAEGKAVQKLLREVRAPRPNPYFWLQTQIDSAPENQRQNKLKTLCRAQSRQFLS